MLGLPPGPEPDSAVDERRDGGAAEVRAALPQLGQYRRPLRERGRRHALGAQVGGQPVGPRRKPPLQRGASWRGRFQPREQCLPLGQAGRSAQQRVEAIRRRLHLAGLKCGLEPVSLGCDIAPAEAGGDAERSLRSARIALHEQGRAEQRRRGGIDRIGSNCAAGIGCHRGALAACISELRGRAGRLRAQGCGHQTLELRGDRAQAIEPAADGQRAIGRQGQRHAYLSARRAPGHQASAVPCSVS